MRTVVHHWKAIPFVFYLSFLQNNMNFMKEDAFCALINLRNLYSNLILMIGVLILISLGMRPQNWKKKNLYMGVLGNHRFRQQSWCYCLQKSPLEEANFTSSTGTNQQSMRVVVEFVLEFDKSFTLQAKFYLWFF